MNFSFWAPFKPWSPELCVTPIRRYGGPDDNVMSSPLLKGDRTVLKTETQQGKRSSLIFGY